MPGPTVSKNLVLTIRGIEMLEDTDAWSVATGNYIRDYFESSKSSPGTSDVSVTVQVVKQRSSNEVLNSMFGRALLYWRSRNRQLQTKTKKVEVVFEQTSTWETSNVDKYDEMYMATGAFTGRSEAESYVKMMRNLSPFYQGVSSVGSILVDPPPVGTPVTAESLGLAPLKEETLLDKLLGSDMEESMQISILVAVAASVVLFVALGFVVVRKRRKDRRRRAAAEGDLGDSSSEDTWSSNGRKKKNRTSRNNNNSSNNNNNKKNNTKEKKGRKAAEKSQSSLSIDDLEDGASSSDDNERRGETNHRGSRPRFVDKPRTRSTRSSSYLAEEGYEADSYEDGEGEREQRGRRADFSYLPRHTRGQSDIVPHGARFNRSRSADRRRSAPRVPLPDYDYSDFPPSLVQLAPPTPQIRMIQIVAPPGKLGIVMDTPPDGRGVAYVSHVKGTSPLLGEVFVEDRVAMVDDVDVQAWEGAEISRLMAQRSGRVRRISVLRDVAGASSVSKSSRCDSDLDVDEIGPGAMVVSNVQGGSSWGGALGQRQMVAAADGGGTWVGALQRPSDYHDALPGTSNQPARTGGYSQPQRYEQLQMGAYSRPPQQQMRGQGQPQQPVQQQMGGYSQVGETQQVVVTSQEQQSMTQMEGHSQQNQPQQQTTGQDLPQQPQPVQQVGGQGLPQQPIQQTEGQGLTQQPMQQVGEYNQSGEQQQVSASGQPQQPMERNGGYNPQQQPAAGHNQPQRPLPPMEGQVQPQQAMQQTRGYVQPQQPPQQTGGYLRMQPPMQNGGGHNQPRMSQQQQQQTGGRGQQQMPAQLQKGAMGQQPSAGKDIGEF